MTNPTTTQVVLKKAHQFATGDWMHLFGVGSSETHCRILIDLEQSKLVVAQEWTGMKFEYVLGDRLKDLAESVINVNSAHVDPSNWDLQQVTEMPAWAVGTPSAMTETKQVVDDSGTAQPLTLEAFCKAKEFKDKLPISDDAGFLYPEGLEIIANADGQYLLVLGREESVNCDLHVLEVKLYQAWYLEECFSHLRSEPSLTTDAVARLLAEQDELCYPERVFYYDSLDSLVEKVQSNRNWTQGEVFVFDGGPDGFAVMKQIAPSSCEMLTITNRGFLDVFTAYRFEQAELVAVVREHMKGKNLNQNAE